MQTLLNQLLTWSDEITCKLTPQKSRRWSSAVPPRLIDHHWQFKAHHWKESLSMNCQMYLFLLTYAGNHIEYIISKAVSRLHLLKQLKRAGLSSYHLLHFYTTVIRPVLEHASPLWHPTLTKSQTERLKAVQRRAIIIIFVTSPSLSFYNGSSDLHFISSSKTRGSRWAFFSETFVDLTVIVYTTTLSRPGRDISAQEAYCISKAMPPN